MEFPTKTKIEIPHDSVILKESGDGKRHNLVGTPVFKESTMKSWDSNPSQQQRHQIRQCKAVVLSSYSFIGQFY
jgi:hypothetical protein